MTTAATDAAAIVQALRTVQIEPEALLDIVPFLSRHEFDMSRPSSILSGPGPSREYGRKVHPLLQRAGCDTMLHIEEDGGLQSVEALAERVRTREATLIIGVGDGRILDVAKHAALRAGVVMVAVPTSLAHDGIFSPVASLFDDDGVRHSLGAAASAGLLLDTALVAAAPAATRRAGVGDLLSNVTAVMDWRLADQRGAERYSAQSADLALTGVQSYVDVAWSSDPFQRVTGLAHGLVLSGLAMTAAGTSRPCSGAEHLVSHALEASDTTMRELFTTVGLPTHPGQLGLSDELFRTAVERAPVCRPGRYTVLSEASANSRSAELMRRAYR